MNDAVKILHEKELKITPLRESVLYLFKKSNKGLSKQDLKRLLPIPFDRSTLFRTLNTFERKEILHKIIDEEGVTQYAFSDQKSIKKTAGHAHFFCIRCKKIFCLDYSITLAKIPVSEGFEKQGVAMQVRGICQRCLSKNKRN